METNYFGALRCIQALLPQMRQRRSGCIINVSSVAGRLSCPPLISYCSSKWALEALTEGLAGEMRTFNVRVASVEPGIIATSLADRIQESGRADSQYRQGTRFVALYEMPRRRRRHRRWWPPRYSKSPKVELGSCVTRWARTPFHSCNGAAR